MSRYAFLLCALLFSLATANAQYAKTPAPEGAEVYIISPHDGEVVHGEVTIQFGLKGMGVAPAGVDLPNTGHHHLLIDVESLPDMNVALPATDHIKHFGGGQTETTISLPKGKHTLQLLLADRNHVPHESPILSEKIHFSVE
ncbi:MAG: DUF4399 domain-containing protein [Bdellovibrionales bacterium]|nr:DUF4399 domain-containing protein [Bdellovibrionales bacterium]